jgi:N-acetylglucosaminyldiphosphoundecaprenol N-acetyl-beta-D-mannosaminyltransferase
MNLSLNRKEVGKFPLDDCSTSEIIEFISGERPLRKIAVGVHVTTLNSLYASKLTRMHFDVADVVYCDGWSMYILGKVAGLRNIQRIATTDLYPLLISQLNRPLKIYFFGGDSQLGPLIIANWIEKYPQDSCAFFDGFPSDWQETFSRIKNEPPDILFLGLGMPLELQILQRYENILPDCLIITCGGMLRILAGVERRSPKLIQNLKLEWLFRLVTSPSRTFSRYFSGTLNVSIAIFQIMLNRTASKH